MEEERKKRAYGQYKCLECDKIFKRTDHLARHQLNHNPKEVFECTYVLTVHQGQSRKCGKTFVRKDLLDRHMKRHIESKKRSRVNFVSPVAKSLADAKETPSFKSDDSFASYTPHSMDLPLQILLLIHAEPKPETPVELQGLDGDSLFGPQGSMLYLFTEEAWMPGNMDFGYNLGNTDILRGVQNPLDDYVHQDLVDGLSIPSSTSFTSPTSTNESTPGTATELYSPSSINLHKRISEYAAKYNTASNKQAYVDTLIVDSLFTALPALQRTFVESIFSDQVPLEARFSYYMLVYWLVFHPQFNILHRASFDTATAEPLLLLSMILIGCNYCTPCDLIEHINQARLKSPEYKLAFAIAVPLRFAIFQHDGFRSPVKLWVLQSLNLLEWSEKNFLSRSTHERAHIFHAATVQLLRRSPALGGNPAKVKLSDDEDEDNEKYENDLELFQKWVHSESMRRITFLTFYFDIADYLKFRHNPIISFNQLQLLKLPCSDELWDAPDISGSFAKVLKRQKHLSKTRKLFSSTTFMSALKKLLKGNSLLDYTISPFLKKVLFGGLLSVMHQMQQFELNNSVVSLSNQNHQGNFQAWKEVLSVAIDDFNSYIKESCQSMQLPAFSSSGISSCKFPLYHLGHITGISELNTYDISIFCGSPANQNVTTTPKDRQMVERKLSGIWKRQFNFNEPTLKQDIINLKGVVHCFVLLWETLLGDSQVWNPDKDYFDGMFAISLAMQTLWSYCFLTGGQESSRFDDIKDNMSGLNYSTLADLSAENGYEYLERLKKEFVTHLRRDGLHHTHSIENIYQADSTVQPHEIIFKYSSILHKLTNIHHISGLCFLVGIKLFHSQWELVRENGWLLINCGFRSVGKQDVLCEDVFDVKLLD